ncbi:hypothetical protein Goari_009314 [Gossypium aridum]|uniref:Chlorophyll a-b binding protein, chloroplastic n=1 Tax=Gossypium aridum TaxID=34290 RepID=A0A7J8XXB3_GOSAI|nr:hypothetical protein [Gossypium aridum]
MATALLGGAAHLRLPLAVTTTTAASKGNPMAVKALRRTPATPFWAHGSVGVKNNA